MGYIEYVTGIQPDTFTADDMYSKAQGTRDGAIFTADWILARCAEGRVFSAMAGSGSTVATFGAGSMDTTEPDLFVSVPSGTTIVPLEINIQMEAYGSALAFETMAACGTGGVVPAAANYTAVTPKNLRSDVPFTSNCTVCKEGSAAFTYMTTNVVEFWRDGLQKAITAATATVGNPMLQPFKFSWNYRTAGFVPVVVGAAQLAIYASAQAGTGYIEFIYCEVPSTRIV